MYSLQAKSRHTRCVDTSQHVFYVYFLRLATKAEPVATETFSSSVCFVLPLAYNCLQQGTQKASQACQKILDRLKTDCVVRPAACHTSYVLTAAKRVSRSEMHGLRCHLPVQVQQPHMHCQAFLQLHK